MPHSDSHQLALPTATGGLARLVATEARAARIDLEPLLRASGLSAAQIQDTEERLGAEEQIAFVEAAARALERDRLGALLCGGFLRDPGRSCPAHGAIQRGRQRGGRVQD